MTISLFHSLCADQSPTRILLCISGHSYNYFCFATGIWSICCLISVPLLSLARSLIRSFALSPNTHTFNNSNTTRLSPKLITKILTTLHIQCISFSRSLSYFLYSPHVSFPVLVETYTFAVSRLQIHVYICDATNN